MVVAVAAAGAVAVAFAAAAAVAVAAAAAAVAVAFAFVVDVALALGPGKRWLPRSLRFLSCKYHNWISIEPPGFTVQPKVAKRLNFTSERTAD